MLGQFHLKYTDIALYLDSFMHKNDATKTNFGIQKRCKNGRLPYNTQSDKVVNLN